MWASLFCLIVTVRATPPSPGAVTLAVLMPPPVLLAQSSTLENRDAEEKSLEEDMERARSRTKDSREYR